ncbi:MAG TPA: hypothetical protein PKV43_14110, partial [Armatimonadota bacterium]|nr:hypothetical protein [Armatimonadota bacterium]
MSPYTLRSERDEAAFWGVFFIVLLLVVAILLIAYFTWLRPNLQDRAAERTRVTVERQNRPSATPEATGQSEEQRVPAEQTEPGVSDEPKAPGAEGPLGPASPGETGSE